MRSREAGTSVLAALVFVAIFVLFISGYKVASQDAQTQSAAAASAYSNDQATCAPGEVYTVDMASGAGSVRSLNCSEGSGSAGRPECAQGIGNKCAVRYCPPSSYVTETDTCFVVEQCEPGSTTCLRGTIQNATQPQQAASIIAAQLLEDRGSTSASAASGRVALAAKLSESGRVAVASVIDETADAADENNIDAAPIRDVARGIQKNEPAKAVTGPVAQISCQPKIVESGMKVGIAFGCANSVTSEGGGFSTGDMLWGATEERLPLNLPNGTMTYALKCSDGIRSSSASCSVAVMRPFMLLSSQSENGEAAIAWVTRGMDVCDLNAPENAGITSQFVNPVPQSGALTVSGVQTDTQVVLTCTTVGGAVQQVATMINPGR